MTSVHLKDYRDTYHQAQQVYRQNKDKITSALPFADIQHIGSSAIPGSVTKGDVDLNVRVYEKSFKDAVEELKELYDINQPENWTNAFASFKDDTSFDLPVGIQLTVIDSEYDDFVKLRDLIVNDLKLLEEYNKMKKKYEGKSMEEYRKEKSEFFERLRKILK